MRRVRSPPWLPLLIGALVVGGLAGCSEQGDDGASATTSSGSTVPSTTVETTTAEPAPPANAAEPADGYEVLDLGTLGGDAAWASDVNASGQIVGTSKTEVAAGEAGRFEAFIWDPDRGRMQGLGALGPDPRADSTASAINDAGVVVGAWGPLDCVEPGCRAARWDTSTGQMDDLGTLADADSDALDVNSAALDINAAGRIVGHSTTSSGEHHAFLWDPATETMTDLGTLGGSYSVAHGINDRGEVTGESSTATGLMHAFLWSPETGQMHDLGANRPEGEDHSGLDINDDLTVVGTRAGGTEGFIWWNDDRGIQDLGNLLALDINNSGLIVGARLTTDPSATRLPVVYSGSRGTTVELPGITGTSEGTAHAINDQGVIVGLVSARDPLVGPRAVRWWPVAA